MSVPAPRSKRSTVRAADHPILRLTQPDHPEHADRAPPAPASVFLDPPVPAATIDELGARHLRWAMQTYVKRGAPTSTPLAIARALALLTESGLGRAAVSAFGPRLLRRYQEWLAARPGQPLARRTINAYVKYIVRMFRWAVTEELVPATAWTALGALPALRRGRGDLREGRRVRPVEQDQLDATLPHLQPMLADMVELLRLTGMRPNECFWIRARDLHPLDGGALKYHVPPEANKVEHEEITDPVFIGPRARAIIERWRRAGPEDPDRFIFDPRISERLRLAARAESRATPRWKSHDPAGRRRRARARGVDASRVGVRFTPAAFRRAIARAIDRHNRLHPGQSIEPWFPYQLRHAAATRLVAGARIEVAKTLLRHRDIRTTQGYITVGQRRAAAAALRHG